MIGGLFEPTNITKQTLAEKLTKLVDGYALKKKIIAYLKVEGNLHKCITWPKKPTNGR
jgi:hypothetical protein